MKQINTGRPGGRQLVNTPYGLPPLVEASKKLVKTQVLGDLTDLICDIVIKAPGHELQNYVVHTGFMDPQGSVGLLDFSYSFNSAGLNGLQIDLLVQNIEGGNGLPLTMGSPIAQARLRLDPRGMGELECLELEGVRDDWVEFIRHSVIRFKELWMEGLAHGLGTKISNDLSREKSLTDWLRKGWTAHNFRSVLTNLALEMHLIDDEDEAEHHVSSLEFKAQQIHLVTPALALELKKRGAVAGIHQGLPLWSRDNRDAPHLEPVLQDIAYDQFGESVDAELASSQSKE